PNIVLINCDDLGWGDLACYGGTAIKTPHLDALAGRGVRFTESHACDSVCTPSRAGLLTGRYPKRMGLDFPLNAGATGLNAFETTLPQALKLRGYHTAMVGKWHLGDYTKDKGLNPTNFGFDSYLG
ncbi:hypothetical protein DAPPUDRAFT_17868, partial [Daphnia pulex]